MAKYECQRCHEGLDLPELAPKKRCVGCHQDIRAGRFKADSRVLARWNSNLKSLPGAPSLAGIGTKRSTAWIAEYLLDPHDLRPGLKATMPRLALTRSQAQRIAAALAGPSLGASSPIAVSEDAVARGAKLYAAGGCGGCHATSTEETLAAQLAPNLVDLKSRFRPETLVRWLADPNAVTPGTLMPPTGLTMAENQDLAAYLWTQTGQRPAPKPFQRLPLLRRKVRFKEVSQRVFRKLCWHCHSQPDFARGDGGPGNTGGMGFRGLGLDLSTYTGISRGVRGPTGRRQSIFAKDAEGVPRLVRSLLARHKEEQGGRVDGLLGMPLGFPALPAEDIQLIESWVAQGRPRRARAVAGSANVLRSGR